MSTNKKYGLILNEKVKSHQPVFQASRNVFGTDSDSDDGNQKKLPPLRSSHILNKKAQIAQEKAVDEDPTVYQYDEIYELLSKKEKESKKPKTEKKAKYIENLIKTANKRKIEHERRIERQVQKEREKEGDEFADKEVFVTSAYKKKLEEMQLEEEREKREEYLESIGDVTKQKDLGGFYRHLYEQKLGSNSLETSSSKDKLLLERTLTSFNDKKEITETSKKRNYRKRHSSDSKHKLSEGEIEDSDDEVNRVSLKVIRDAKMSKTKDSNIDADSDFIDDSSEDGDSHSSTDKDTQLKNNKKSDTITTENKDSSEKIENENSINKSLQDQHVMEEKNEEIMEKKPKLDIWKKRTIGKVFDDALQRYYERKATRGI